VAHIAQSAALPSWHPQPPLAVRLCFGFFGVVNISGALPITLCFAVFIAWCRPGKVPSKTNFFI
jgi:hypothetical protein